MWWHVEISGHFTRLLMYFSMYLKARLLYHVLIGILKLQIIISHSIWTIYIKFLLSQEIHLLLLQHRLLRLFVFKKVVIVKNHWILCRILFILYENILFVLISLFLLEILFLEQLVFLFEIIVTS